MKKIILISTFLASGLFAHGGWGFGGGCCMGWWPFLGFGGGIWGIIGIVIAIATLYMIFLLLRNLGKRADHREESSALEILKARYARGEISEEEFKRMKEELRNKY